jgi:hypothetical protein
LGETTTGVVILRCEPSRASLEGCGNKCKRPSFETRARSALLRMTVVRAK